MPDQLQHDKVKAIGDIIEHFMVLRPEYSGAFWNQYEFAEHILAKLDELEQAEHLKWLEVQEAYPTEPF